MATRTRSGGQRAAIAAGHPESARAGASVLGRGGSAVDACVAAAVASWVAEPTVSGPGGGGFMLVWDARRRRVSALDFFVAVPGAGLDRPPAASMDDLVVEFGTTTQLFRVGPASCAVPGVPAGLAEAHRRFGRLPWADLVEPAIRLAREGTPLTDAHAALHAILDPILRTRPESAAVFGPHGRPLEIGETVRNLRLADTLERVAERGAAELYTGATGRTISEYLLDNGGAVTRDDLASYRVVTRRALAIPYRGRTLRTNPPPSAGGVLIGHSLGVLERLQLARDPWDVRSLRLVAGALRSAQAQRTPRFERALYRGGAPALVLDPDLVAHAAASLPGVERSPEPVGARGTTQVSVLDADGNAASLTTSTGCGSGVFAAETGVHLNNMLGETDLATEGVALSPGMRLTSMMSPSLVLRGDEVELALGSSGSARIRSTLVQILTRTIDARMPLTDAILAPRLHPSSDALDCEGGFPEGALDGLERAGEPVLRWPGRNIYFGGAQAVGVGADGGAVAAGDPRRGGEGIVVEVSPRRGSRRRA
jgi:gamma-glutamyltranspeptidase/glutathione hydrolase